MEHGNGVIVYLFYLQYILAWTKLGPKFFSVPFLAKPYACFFILVMF